MAYDADQTLTFSVYDLTRIVGLTPRAIRLYEDHGLISAKRDHLNQRRFDRTAPERLTFIKLLRAAGLGLPAIKAILAAPIGDGGRAATAQPALAAQRQLALQQLAAIDAAETQLRSGTPT